VVKTYNKMIRILVAFECVWFDAWVAQVDKAKAGLHATLIVRHPTTRKLYINFDPGERQGMGFLCAPPEGQLCRALFFT
jgi:hypothetical protein